MNLACEICKKRIEHHQEVVKIEAGPRNKGIHPSYTKHSHKGVAAVHIDCLDIEHNQDFPERTTWNVVKQLEKEVENP